MLPQPDNILIKSKNTLVLRQIAQQWHEASMYKPVASIVSDIYHDAFGTVSANGGDTTLFSRPRSFKQLRQVFISDLSPNPVQNFNGTYIRITLGDVAQSFADCYSVSGCYDEQYNEMELRLYNLPGTGSANLISCLPWDGLENIGEQLRAVFKRGMVLLIRNPWLKSDNGIFVVRVDNTKDVAIVRTTDATIPRSVVTCCGHCGGKSEKALRRCSTCVGVFYCATDCQMADWMLHKKFCRTFQENLEEHAKSLRRHGL